MKFEIAQQVVAALGLEVDPAVVTRASLIGFGSTGAGCPDDVFSWLVEFQDATSIHRPLSPSEVEALAATGRVEVRNGSPHAILTLPWGSEDFAQRSRPHWPPALAATLDQLEMDEAERKDAITRDRDAEYDRLKVGRDERERQILAGPWAAWGDTWRVGPDLPDPSDPPVPEGWSWGWSPGHNRAIERGRQLYAWRRDGKGPPPWER